MAGRVEIFIEGLWGTICDDGFDDADAQVICGQLGYRDGRARTNAYYGQGLGTVWLKDVDCDGDEDNVMKCDKSFSWDGWYCNHDEDASVTCYQGILCAIDFLYLLEDDYTFYYPRY